MILELEERQSMAIYANANILYSGGTPFAFIALAHLASQKLCTPEGSIQCLDHAEHEKETINICRALFERCLQSKLQKIQDMDPSCEFCSRKLPFKKMRTHVK